MKRFCIVVLVALWLATAGRANDDHPFRVVYFDNYAPYSWRDDGGNMRGAFIDILDAVIGQRMQIPLEHHGFPWARAQQYVRNGEFDAMIAPATAERTRYAELSGEPVLNSRMAAFTRAGHPQLRRFEQTRSLADIESFDFVTQLGDGWAEENLAAMDVQYVNDLDTVLKMLNLGRADLFIEASLVTHWNLANLDLTGAITEVEGVTIEETPYYLMISKKSSRQFLREFDRHMRELVEDGEFERLLQRYR